MPVKKKFILSDESVNSYGFRVLTSGIDITQFKANPVMLLNHDEDDVPGNWQEVNIEDGKLVAVTNFDEKDPEAMKLASKVERGFVNGASIGFQILETSNDPQLMLPGQTRPTVTKCKLYEASICPLPSNSNALALYDTTGKKLSMTDEVLNTFKLSLIQSQHKTETMKLNLKNLQALNLQESATEADINAALETRLKQAADDAAELKQLKEAAAAKLKADAKQVVADAVKDKKLTAEQAPEWEALAEQNLEAAKKALSSMPGVKPINTQLKDGEVKTDGVDRTNWKLSDWRKNDSEGLAKLKVDSPEKYKALVDENK
jgi:HK97 family phage prohead protease